ncbi:hypothetical protein [Janthinobacterium sp. RT4P48]|uniref:hypothetical protein n=1 Tax=Janthinobacterium sp. RT4P48 TaxID=3424188 RepID=UPI003F22B2A0
MEWVTLNISSVVPYFTIGKDLAMAGIAFYAARIASKGLTTWNRQLKGGAEYDLARRILKCTYRLREAFDGVRNPAMFSTEMPFPPEEDAGKMNDSQIRHYGRSRAYQNRWQKVFDVRNDLRTELLEAEALWGEEILTKFKRLFELQHDLFSTVYAYLAACDPDATQEARKINNELYDKKSDILYRNYSEGNPDKFNAAVKVEISVIENFLKPHLLKN